MVMVLVSAWYSSDSFPTLINVPCFDDRDELRRNRFVVMPYTLCAIAGNNWILPAAACEGKPGKIGQVGSIGRWLMSSGRMPGAASINSVRSG
jgi:hypothetical protein